MDDNKGLAEILSFTLEDAGHSVRVAGSGAEALAAMSHDTFDVAVLDLQLPDLTGLELFTALRADTPGSRASSSPATPRWRAPSRR